MSGYGRASSDAANGLLEHDIDSTRMILDLDTICTDVMLTFLSFNHEGENTVRKTLEELKQKRMITNFYENES